MLRPDRSDDHARHEDQNAFAVRSPEKAAVPQANARPAKKIVPVTSPRDGGEPKVADRDGHPRATTIEAIARLPTPFAQERNGGGGQPVRGRRRGAVLIVASEAAARRHGLTPIARILGGTTAGVLPAHHGPRRRG